MNVPVSTPAVEAEPNCEFGKPVTVTLEIIAGYLIGRRTSILALAQYSKLWLLGGVLVLSAGFAREYDGEDLLHEPWHVFIPHAASLMTSIILYCLCRGRQVFRQFLSGYSMFLGLFWMTAPLAWIYAIPFERFLSDGNATRANLYLLGIVSVWRVCLMIRVITVVYDVEAKWQVVFAVLFFGDAVMLTALHFMPAPILQVMGGVRMTESEQVLMTTKLLLQVIGFPTLLVLTIGYLCAIPVTTGVAKPAAAAVKAGRFVWPFAWASVLIWAVILPFTQPALVLSHQVDQDLRSGKIQEALQLMSQHEPSDFPSFFSPAPQVALPTERLLITDVMQEVIDGQASIAPWVRKLYLDKFSRKLSDVFWYRGSPDEVVKPYLQILLQLEVAEWFDDDDYRLTDVRVFVVDAANDEENLGEFSESTLQMFQELRDRLVLHENVPANP